MNMSNTDALLLSLAAEPLPAELQGIKPEVMSRLLRRLEARGARRSLAMAGLIAIAVGAANGLSPPSDAYAAQPLLGVPAQAPSNLLAH
jgi:phosphoribosylcarboxyaminoimidazole (NCAIR) mutase